MAEQKSWDGVLTIFINFSLWAFGSTFPSVWSRTPKMWVSGKPAGKASGKFILLSPEPLTFLSFSSSSNNSHVKGRALFPFFSYRAFHSLSYQQWRTSHCPLKCYFEDTRVASLSRWILACQLQFQTNWWKTCASKGEGVRRGCIKMVVRLWGVRLQLQQKVGSGIKAFGLHPGFNLHPPGSPWALNGALLRYISIVPKWSPKISGGELGHRSVPGALFFSFCMLSYRLLLKNNFFHCQKTLLKKKKNPYNNNGNTATVKTT